MTKEDLKYKEKLKNKIKKMLNLKSFKSKSEQAILAHLVIKGWKEKDRIKKFENSPLSWLVGIFETDTLIWLEDQYNKVIKDFVLNESSDIQQLQAYIYKLGRNRVLAEEIKEDPAKEAVNMDYMSKNMEELLKIGKALKLNKEQRVVDKQQKNLQDALMTIYNRVEKYVKNHQGEFIWKCGHCKQMNVLPNTPAWMYENNTPFSKECWDLVVQEVLTLQQMADILRTSTFGMMEMAKARGLWDKKFEVQVK